LTWENKHVPLSVSSCSNVPGFKDPKCFITEGDPHQLLKQFVEYLVSISQESYRLLLGEFEQVFADIDAKIDESGNPEIDEVVNLLVDMLESQEPTADDDDCGIDVMNSDDEEQIESENEEDRAFLDDESDVEEQGVNFYRALDRELQVKEQEEIVDNDVDVDGTNEKNKPHPLIKLKVYMCVFIYLLFIFIFYSFIHSFIHSYIHSFTYSFIYSLLTRSLYHSPIRSLFLPLIIYSFVLIVCL